MAKARSALMGRRIRQLRKARGLTIRELADLADLDPSFLTHLELATKYPSVDTLEKIADGLGTSPAAFFRDKTTPEQVPLDQQAHHQLRILLAGRSDSEKRDIISALKLLKDHRRARALLAAFTS